MGRYAGQIKIVSDKKLYGRIVQEEGRTLFIKDIECPDWVSPLIRGFATNPEESAASYGLLTGRCCFCYKQLTDIRSIAVGYGKTCARNYGLTWSNPSE